MPLITSYNLNQSIPSVPMELKKQLLEWYNTQLEQKSIFITSLEELSTGYIFLEVLHNFHPKTVDLSKSYIKPKNQYEVLQNYKHLVNCFSRLGWKKFDPERYAKKKEKDYLSLAQTLKKILSLRSLKESRLQSNLDVTLQEFKNEEDSKQLKQPHEGISAKISKLQKKKKQLLIKLARIQGQIYTQSTGDDEKDIASLKLKIKDILQSNIPT